MEQEAKKFHVKKFFNNFILFWFFLASCILEVALYLDRPEKKGSDDQLTTTITKAPWFSSKRKVVR